MSAESKLVALLSGDSAVSALVSARVYPLILPQAPTLPAITYSRIAPGAVYSLQGYSNLENPLIQVDCWGSTYAGVKDLATKVKAAMDGASSFKSVVQAERDMYEDDVRLYRVSLDFSVWNREE